MHLIVSNIPENFRSRDLRNFFSEFIEREAFKCFHFRHRPQSQLMDIIKRSSPTQNSGTSGSNMPLNNKLKNSDFKPPHTKTVHTEREGDNERNNFKTATQGTTNKEDTDADNETMAESNRNESDDSHTHWLSSGLAGLASLISEKKQEVRSHTKSPENAGRTCCVVDMNDGHVETFLKKYNHKHWVTHEGDILPQRCYLLRVDFQDPRQVDGESGPEIWIIYMEWRSLLVENNSFNMKCSNYFKNDFYPSLIFVCQQKYKITRFILKSCLQWTVTRTQSHLCLVNVQI